MNLKFYSNSAQNSLLVVQQLIWSPSSLLSLMEYFRYWIFEVAHKKSRVRETPTLSTNADSRTNTNLKRLRDLSHYFFSFIIFFLREVA